MPYDLAAVARSWGSFAGILAGFAFAAVVQTLTRPTGDRERDGHVVVALVSAFLGLLVGAIMYAVLNGERADTFVAGRGATEELLAAVVMGFAALTLLYAIVVMIDDRGLSSAAKAARFMIALFVPALVTLEVSLGGADNMISEAVATGARKPGCGEGSYHSYLRWGVWAPAVTVLIISALVWWRSGTKPGSLALRLRPYVPQVALLLVVSTAVFFAWLPETNFGFRLAHWLLYAFAWATAFFAIMIAALTVARPDSGVTGKAGVPSASDDVLDHLARLVADRLSTVAPPTVVDQPLDEHLGAE